MMPKPPPKEAWEVSGGGDEQDPKTQRPKDPKSGRFVIPWDSERFPRRLHWEVTEAVKQMIIRAARDPGSAVNVRRRKAEAQTPIPGPFQTPSQPSP